MPTTIVEVSELPDRIADVLSQAAAGTEVIVTVQEIPRAKLIPLSQPNSPRVPDLHPGAFVIADDFDAPLSEDDWVRDE